MAVGAVCSDDGTGTGILPLFVRLPAGVRAGPGLRIFAASGAAAQGGCGWAVSAGGRVGVGLPELRHLRRRGAHRLHRGTSGGRGALGGNRGAVSAACF